MGDMADFALDQAFDEQSRAFGYISGDIPEEEAFDAGLIDHNGEYSPAMREAMDWSDGQDMSPEGVDSMLERLSGVGCPAFDGRIGGLTVYSARIDGRLVVLNRKAYDNLENDAPTCNECEHEMMPRMGAYGEFYFCRNGCADQATVSASYWGKVKRAFGFRDK